MTDAQITSNIELESELRDATPDSQEHTEDSLETADPLGAPGNEQAQLDAEARLEDDGPDGQATTRRINVQDSQGKSHVLTVVIDGDPDTQDPVLLDGKLVGAVGSSENALNDARQRFGQANTVDLHTGASPQGSDELQQEVQALDQQIAAAEDANQSEEVARLSQELADKINAEIDNGTINLRDFNDILEEIAQGREASTAAEESPQNASFIERLKQEREDTKDTEIAL